jgi:methionine-rich copper-binding protein CopC/putative copper export protein
MAGMRHRHAAAVLAGLLLGLLAAPGLPAEPAAAHAVLVRTEPAAGAIVGAEPAAVTVTFSEPVRPVTGKIKILAPDGRAAGQDTPTTRGAVLTVPLRAGTGNGTYLVSYRVISMDAHPVGGSFTFSVGAPSPPPAPGAAATGGRVDPVVAVAMGAVRWLGYAGLVLVVGPTLLLMLLWPARLARRGPSRLAGLGLALVALGAVLETYLQAPYGNGGGVFAVTGGDLREVLDSRFGAVHLVRLGVLSASAILLWPVLAGRDTKVDRIMLAVLAVVGLATWPVGGHPAASAVPTLTVLADAAHLAAMSVWLGGLVMLLGFLLRKATLGELRVILPVWSAWAMLAVAVLAIAGTAQALVEIASPAALVDTTYGRLVLLKIVLLAAVLGVARYSRRTVERIAALPVAAGSAPVPAADPEPAAAGPSPAERASTDPEPADPEPVGSETAVPDAGGAEPTVPEPADSGPTGVAATGSEAAAREAAAREAADPGSADPEATDHEPMDAEAEGTEPAPTDESTVDARVPEEPVRRRLRWAVLAEATGILAVLALAAALVQTTPARNATVANQQQRGPFVTTLTSDLYILDVDVDPAEIGPNGIHLFAFTPQRQPLAVLEWHATVALPANGIDRLDVPLLVIDSTHTIAEINLPEAGDWEFRFTLVVSEFEQRTVTTTVPIR